MPEDLRSQKTFLTDILVEDGAHVDENTSLATITVAGRRATLISSTSDKITFYKFPEEELRFGDYIAKFEAEK